MNKITRIGILISCILMLLIGQKAVRAQVNFVGGVASAEVKTSNSLTYQGQVLQNDEPVSGACDFQFSLWDAVSAGNQIGSLQTLTKIQIVNGLFAVRAARGMYIILMNSDTVLQEGVAEILIRFLKDHPKAAAAGPKVLNFDGTLQSKGAPLLSVFSTVMILLGVSKNILTRKLEQTLFPKICWDENRTTRVGWIAGCCMMIRKEATALLGGLCEELFFYGEEVEWCHRANKAGWEIWYVPEASVFHIGGYSTSPEMRQAIQDKDLQLRNYRVLMKNTVGLGRGTAISFITIILKYFRYLVSLAINREERFSNDLLRQARWETVVFRYLLTNGSTESRASIQIS